MSGGCDYRKMSASSVYTVSSYGCHDCSGSEVRREFVMSEPKRKLDLKSKKLLSGWGPCLHIDRSVAQDERAGPGQLPL